MNLKSLLNDQLSNLWPQPPAPVKPKNPTPNDLRSLRKGIPPATPKVDTADEFFLRNLRGPSIKRGPTLVYGWNEHLNTFADWVRTIHLFETDFVRKPIIPGVARKRPPELPNNVFWLQDPTHTVELPPSGPYGAAVLFKPVEDDTIAFVPGARIMGPVQHVKGMLRGRKFFILNRCSDSICVELV